MKANNNFEKIDFVVTWVDTNDADWLEEYGRYRGIKHESDRARYRNWDLFRYWFRAVENYAPWVNKVFLITNGKFPDWINPRNPKLVLVRHDDFIPSKYLPTFNSISIELNFNKINGLSEHFVYFNDDMYLNAPLKPNFFFRNGLPCDFNHETVFLNTRYDPINRFNIRIQMFCDVAVLNHHFYRKDVLKKSWKKWYGPHLWFDGLLMSLFITMSRKGRFEGFKWRHTEQPMLKSVIDEIWDKEYEMMDKSCTRFRVDTSLNPYIIRYWQFASNRFYPTKSYDNKIDLLKENIDKIESLLVSKKAKTICLNDTPRCIEEDYNLIKPVVLSLFDKKFPKKSSFEI